jgi:hypothetical protein
MHDREERHQQLELLQLNWFSTVSVMAGLTLHMPLLVPSRHLGRPLVVAEILVPRLR